MAFLKSYAFFVLILFPCSLHVVHALNYATFNPHSNFMLRWSYDNNKLIFNMTCKVMGWCAVGFTETDTGRNMEMYDIAAGGVASNTPYLKVSFCISTGGDSYNKRCFGRKTNIFRESGDFAGNRETWEIFREIWDIFGTLSKDLILHVIKQYMYSDMHPVYALENGWTPHDMKRPISNVSN